MIQFLSILFFLGTSFSFGQNSQYRPFKMVIVSPDTAIIDEGLRNFVDSIESDYVKRYYRSIKQMEDYLAFKKDPDDTKGQFGETRKKFEDRLRVAKQSEEEVKRFKYFETIAVYSNTVMQMHFKEDFPNSTFQVVRTKDLESKNLKGIAENYQADYVISYKNIHTEKLDNGLIAMNLTTIVFANKEAKIIFEKQTTGDMNNYGEIWTCSNPLSCLLITSAKLSMTEVFETVSRHWKSN